MDFSSNSSLSWGNLLLIAVISSTEVEEITAMSKRLPQLNEELDEKSMRWLELSEIKD